MVQGEKSRKINQGIMQNVNKIKERVRFIKMQMGRALDLGMTHKNGTSKISTLQANQLQIRKADLRRFKRIRLLPNPLFVFKNSYQAYGILKSHPIKSSTQYQAARSPPNRAENCTRAEASLKIKLFLPFY